VRSTKESPLKVRSPLETRTGLYSAEKTSIGTPGTISYCNSPRSGGNFVNNNYLQERRNSQKSDIQIDDNGNQEEYPDIEVNFQLPMPPIQPTTENNYFQHDAELSSLMSDHGIQSNYPAASQVPIVKRVLSQRMCEIEEDIHVLNQEIE